MQEELDNLKVDTLEKVVEDFEENGIRFENDKVKYRIDLLKEFDDNNK